MKILNNNYTLSPLALFANKTSSPDNPSSESQLSPDTTDTTHEDLTAGLESHEDLCGDLIKAAAELPHTTVERREK